MTNIQQPFTKGPKRKGLLAFLQYRWSIFTCAHNFVSIKGLIYAVTKGDNREQRSMLVSENTQGPESESSSLYMLVQSLVSNRLNDSSKLNSLNITLPIFAWVMASNDVARNIIHPLSVKFFHTYHHTNTNKIQIPYIKYHNL